MQAATMQVAGRATRSTTDRYARCIGVQESRFAEVLVELVTPARLERIGAALGPIVVQVARWKHWARRTQAR